MAATERMVWRTTSDVMATPRDSFSRGMPPPPSPAAPQLTCHPRQSMFYDTRGKKPMYIFDHRIFEKPNRFGYPEYNKQVRGDHCDVTRLKDTFGKPGRFEVHDPFDDFTYSKMKNKLRQLCSMDHRDTSCIAFVILTQAESNGELWAADRTYPLSDVIDLVLTEPRLAGKPKLFFVQACLNEKNVDPGFRAAALTDLIPTCSDGLVFYSSFEDHAQFRDPSAGSWMIQSLCDVMDAHYTDSHVLRMMTSVNAAVDRQLALYNQLTKYHKNHITEVRCNTMTKFLKF